MSGRSPAVRAANARRRRLQRRLMAAGLWEPLVDAGPVRDHVNRLREAGMSVKGICRATGLSLWALDYLLWRSSGQGPCQKVVKEHAVALLSFWPKLGDFPDGARIDPCGYRRRMEALLLRGFTFHVIARESGLGETTLWRGMVADRVTARATRLVRGAYDRLWDARPEDFGVSPAMAARQRRLYESRGCVPAMAWDDESIDDPDAVPVLDAEEPAAQGDEEAVTRWLLGESVVLNTEGRRAVVAYLMEWSDLTVEQIGERLGIEADSVNQAWLRVRRRAREAGRTPPERRVYVAPQRLEDRVTSMV